MSQEVCATTLSSTSTNLGTVKWKFKTGGVISSSPAIGSDGTIYVGSEDDYLYAINPDGTLKWKFKASDGIGSSPAIGSDGTIYVGSDDGYLYAISSNSNGFANSPWPKFHHDDQNTGRVSATMGPGSGSAEGGPGAD